MFIPAEAHSDDYNLEVKFDAAGWFLQASDEEITALADCGWGGDVPADAVAQHFEGIFPEITELFRYLEIIREDPSKEDCSGFECHVESGPALDWIVDHRPELAKRLLKDWTP